jgi:6-pyruvoyl tetrahydropterin synthase
MSTAAISFSLGNSMPFELTTSRHFSASHQLRLYDGSIEAMHGHNWVVKVMIAASLRQAADRSQNGGSYAADAMVV